MRPMSLAVCANNLIFFAHFNKEICYIRIVIHYCDVEFSGGDPWMKKINLCSCNNSSEIFTISFLHHRHIHEYQAPSVTY